MRGRAGEGGGVWAEVSAPCLHVESNYTEQIGTLEDGNVPGAP